MDYNSTSAHYVKSARSIWGKNIELDVFDGGSVISGGLTMMSRTAIYSGTNLVFSDGKFQVSGSSKTQNNRVCVPYQIYGIKTISL